LCPLWCSSPAILQTLPRRRPDNSRRCWNLGGCSRQCPSVARAACHACRPVGAGLLRRWPPQCPPSTGALGIGEPHTGPVPVRLRARTSCRMLAIRAVFANISPTQRHGFLHEGCCSPATRRSPGRRPIGDLPSEATPTARTWFASRGDASTRGVRRSYLAQPGWRVGLPGPAEHRAGPFRRGRRRTGGLLARRRRSIRARNHPNATNARDGSWEVIACLRSAYAAIVPQLLPGLRPDWRS
jgi:hypothetical protein